MPNSLDNTPRVSIVLPTFNRAKFLPQAFESIRAQTFGDWELIVVDDGSTDNSRNLVEAFGREVRQPVHYVYQTNQGAYGARNTGVNHSLGLYVAFFDSDDCWLPHHLQDCVTALDANSDVDWVHGAGRIVDLATGRVLAPHSFYVEGRPRPFMGLRAEQRGALRVIIDLRAIECQISDGLYCGLQKSLLRRKVFQDLRFATKHNNVVNEAEDQMFVIRFLAAGHRIGYFDNIHLVYYCHADNSSGSSSSMSVEKKAKLYETMAQAYEELPSHVSLSPSEHRSLKRRLGHEYFWHIGYALLWCNGRRQEALKMFRRGLGWWPFSLRAWKTYGLACARSLISGRSAASA
jgi:glycosyltransferase involved in cell wall biosynthesis